VGRRVAVTGALLIGLMAASASAASAAPDRCPPSRPFGGDTAGAPCWNGPDGGRLPFDSFESAEAFLREALVLEIREIGEGRTQPKKLLLERAGVRAHAVFRHVDSERRNQRLEDGRRHLLLSDSYHVFDALVCNIDRNLGNILIDGEWNIWYIDHTRTFARFQTPPRVSAGVGIDRRVWQRLVAVSDATLQDALEPWLSRWQVSDLLERRHQIVGALRSEIARQGPSNAFF